MRIIDILVAGHQKNWDDYGAVHENNRHINGRA
jgi:hypothetical protein